MDAYFLQTDCNVFLLPLRCCFPVWCTMLTCPADDHDDLANPSSTPIFLSREGQSSITFFCPGDDYFSFWVRHLGSSGSMRRVRGREANLC